ncbi:hypothetical protein [Staphylococcus simulans]|uniref:Uncharacterized protein n=1 Tax=Staphylococcus simulans UMC-CNS-990 TaxID=1405498 RepID=A0ABN0PG47_STASI|nr:hypothetical protein [Staphylococcus simulans]AMG97227.1 hypothetical protein AL483_10570 [Staphylococcus simulans]ATF30505.1 hypothetical protein CO689_06330 [Staphylococcus simulans]ERS94621.1 hypothetical protein SSIM_00580 [Staphylococcus simulans UMC-CNS-990]MCE5147963.1 hypothetical protein [Staphylococcus simulans]PTJ31395.1 hypothetical protein BU026_10700 [Staphylococcus simulans]
MFFNNKKDDEYSFDDFEQEMFNENIIDNEFLEDLDGDLSLDIENDGFMNNDINPTQKYSIILRLFFNDYTELSSSRDRLNAMLEIGIFDDESFEIIDDVIWHAESTLKTYMEWRKDHHEIMKLLDAKSKNIDYRIRKSLEIEQKALHKLNKGIKENNQELAQSGINENEKALNLISPIFEDIQDIIINSF